MTPALEQAGVMEAYRLRPPYQRSDYLGWIARGKRTETRRRLLREMLEELEAGDRYMKMAYAARPRSARDSG